MQSETAQARWVDCVLAFWFAELSPDLWFKPHPTLDDIIRARFLATHTTLATDLDPLDAASAPDQAMASVIVLDQFPRNMFRGTALAFASDHLALAVACTAVERGLDKDLDNNRRLFLYLPFEHSEELCNQHRAVDLFAALGDEKLLQYALAHRDIIARFGRFPHRNAILGRPSTPEEVKFLDAPDNKFW